MYYARKKQLREDDSRLFAYSRAWSKPVVHIHMYSNRTTVDITLVNQYEKMCPI